MEKKIYDSHDIKIYQGDSLSTIKLFSEDTFDGVLTDPPYCSGGLTLSSRQVPPAKKYQLSCTKKQYPKMLGDAKDQRSFTAWATMWLFECWRVSKDGAPILVFTDWRQLPSMSDALQAAGWSWLGIIPWSKRNCRPSLGRFRQQCEYVLFGSKGRFTSSSRSCLPGLYDYPMLASQKVHLTSKPIDLIKDLLAVYPAGGLILDPFLGGGTTALACLATGRLCVGVELSEEYAGISAERIRKFSQDKG